MVGSKKFSYWNQASEEHQRKMKSAKDELHENHVAKVGENKRPANRPTEKKAIKNVLLGTAKPINEKDNQKEQREKRMSGWCRRYIGAWWFLL